MRVKELWQAMKPLFGTIVGVGVFGLPYAFSEAGYAIALGELLLVGFLTMIALLLYADLVLVERNHGRYLSVVGRELNPIERGIASLAFFGSQYGTLLAYLLAGGSFAYGAFAPFLGGSEGVYVALFWLVCSLMLFGGVYVVLKVQGLLLPLLGVLVLFLAVVLFGHIHPNYLLTFHPERFTLPFGICLFAFGGIASIPEIRDLVHGNRKELYSTIVIGITLIAIFYALFTLLVVSVTGEASTPQALVGLSAVAGPWVTVIGNFLGLCIVIGAFLTVGTSLSTTFLYDARQSYLGSWALVALPPFAVFLLGATNITTVIGVTGGILAALIGAFLLLAYERARYRGDLPKHTLRIPSWLVGLTFLMYVGMVALTVIQMLTP